MNDRQLEDLHLFSFDHWYPLFKAHSTRAIIIQLPNELIHFLISDGIHLPKTTSLYRYDNSDNSDSEEEEDRPFQFPSIEFQVTSAINQLGNQVFPKLNWSSPRDATWISLNHTLACSSWWDIYLLLKASDFISSFDLSLLNEYPSIQPVLVLKKFVHFHPGLEFRCWVDGHTMIAISQRDTNQFYAFLVTDQSRIMTRIQDFFTNIIQYKFTPSSYAFDIYLTQSTFEVILIDINPFASTTDTLLFSSTELQTLATSPLIPEFRIVQSDKTYSSCTPVFAAQCVPLDLVAYSNNRSVYEFSDVWNSALAHASVPDSDDN